MADEDPGTPNGPAPLPVRIAAVDELQRLLDDVSTDKGVVLRELAVHVPQIINRALTLEGVHVDLIVLREEFRLSISRQNPPPAVPGWFPMAGVGFTLLTLASLYPLVVGWAPAATKSIFFNVWVAFCVAASASFIGGSATAAGALPLPSQWGQNPVKFTVVGGVAIFVVVLILMSVLNA